MRPVVGLIGLVLALALVGGLLRTQLKALRSSPAPTPAAASAADTSPATPVTPAVASQRLQRQVADDVGKALEQGARRSEGDTEK